MKKAMSLLLALVMVLSLAACGSGGSADDNSSGTTLVYGSADYTRINPAMDEHGEINLLLFNGLTAHDGNDQIVPGLAETWDYDEQTYTYTFHLREGVKWHDGEPFTADDVKFTIEAIMDPENGSENAPNYEDVEEITVIDAQTVAFRLTEPNVAFLEYMTMGILPQHLLAGQDMQESDFFRSPVGTGPYKLESWDAGQSIVLVKNEDYYLGAPKIDRVISRELPDASRETLLVLDATTGQNAVHQAEEFNKAAELTGIILTKLDGTAKGGIVIAISAGLGVPVKLVGVGEGIDDLIDFDRAAFLEAILPPAEQMTGDGENEEEGAEQE